MVHYNTHDILTNAPDSFAFVSPFEGDLGVVHFLYRESNEHNDPLWNDSHEPLESADLSDYRPVSLDYLDNDTRSRLISFVFSCGYTFARNLHS
jgi:hypothetical protein